MPAWEKAPLANAWESAPVVEKPKSLTTREKLEQQDAQFMAQNPGADFNSDEFIFRGLDPKKADQIRKRADAKLQSARDRPVQMPTSPMAMGIKADKLLQQDNTEYKRRLANFERLRSVNPTLAQQIEETGGLEAFLVGAGEGFHSLGRGIGLDAADRNEDNRFVMEYLRSQKPVASAGKLTAQAAPFVVPGGAISNISSIPLRIAAGGVLGASEGNIIARGEGQNVALGTGLGLLVGTLGEAALPMLNRAGRRLAQQQGVELQTAVLPDGSPTPEFQKILEKTGTTMDDIANEAAKTEGVTQQLAQAAKTSKGLEEVIDTASPSPARVQAAQDLGMTPEDVPLPVMSDSQAVQEIGGTLSAMPGTQASTQIDDFAKVMGMKADELIEEMGGSIDQPQASADLLGRMSSRRDALYSAEGKAYDAVGEAIEPSTRVNTKALLGQIEKEAKDIGGVSKLEGPTKRVYQMLKDKPTYGRLDRERKRIGAALAKKEGVYKDAESGELNKLYSQLTQLQEGVARYFGADELWDAAKNQTIARKTLEEQSQTLFGKKLSDPMLPKLIDGLKGVTGKGQKKFTEIINAIPKEDRSAMLATALNGVFTSPRGVNKQFTATHFTKWMDDLKRSPSTYNLVARNLPEGGMKRLEALNELAKGLAGVQRNRVRTGIVKAALDNFDQASGLVNKLYGAGKRLAGRMTGLGELSSEVAEAISKEKNSSVNAVDRLIANPQFKRAFIEAANDPDGATSRRAQKALAESKVYKDFIATKDSGIQSQIAAVGLIPWLMAEEE